MIHGTPGSTIGFRARIVGANTTTGKVTVLVRVKVSSDPVDHAMKAPPKEAWSIHRAGGSTAEAPAVRLGDTFAANTGYFAYFRQSVPQDVDLGSAELCAGRLPGPDACTPLGPVTPLTDDPKSLDLTKF